MWRHVILLVKTAGIVKQLSERFIKLDNKTAIVTAVTTHCIN